MISLPGAAVLLKALRGSAVSRASFCIPAQGFWFSGADFSLRLVLFVLIPFGESVGNVCLL
ncbi:hypothetical protein, partial [Pseudophaeobacter sp.]|uniref:hypothetical protein n=1 Tax=Pseudophaeobacter sp. TaxID=1971739 RepID=UPI002602B3B4